MPIDMKFAHFFQQNRSTWGCHVTFIFNWICDFHLWVYKWYDTIIWMSPLNRSLLPQTEVLTSVSQVSSTEFRIESCLHCLERNRFSLPHFLFTKLPLSVSFLIQLFHMYQCTFEACVARFYSSYYRLMTPIVWKSSFLSVENRLSLWSISLLFKPWKISGQYTVVVKSFGTIFPDLWTIK